MITKLAPVVAIMYRGKLVVIDDDNTYRFPPLTTLRTAVGGFRVHRTRKAAAKPKRHRARARGAKKTRHR